MCTESSSSSLEKKVRVIIGPVNKLHEQYVEYNEELAKANAAIKEVLRLKTFPENFLVSSIFAEMGECEKVEDKLLLSFPMPKGVTPPKSAQAYETVQTYWQACNIFARAIVNQRKHPIFGNYYSGTPIYDIELKPIPNRLLLDIAYQVIESGGNARSSVFTAGALESGNANFLFRDLLAHVETVLHELPPDERMMFAAQDQSINGNKNDPTKNSREENPREKLITLLLSLPNELYMRLQFSKTIAKGSGNYVSNLGGIISTHITNQVEENEKIQSVLRTLLIPDTRLNPVVHQKAVTSSAFVVNKIVPLNVNSNSTLMALVRFSSPLRRKPEPATFEPASSPAPTKSVELQINEFTPYEKKLTIMHLIMHAYRLIAGAAVLRSSIIKNIKVEMSDLHSTAMKTAPITISQSACAIAELAAVPTARSPRMQDFHSDENSLHKGSRDFFSPTLATEVNGKVESQQEINRVSWDEKYEDEIATHIENYIQLINKAREALNTLSSFLCLSQLEEITGKNVDIPHALQLAQELLRVQHDKLVNVRTLSESALVSVADTQKMFVRSSTSPRR